MSYLRNIIVLVILGVDLLLFKDNGVLLYQTKDATIKLDIRK